MKMSNVSFPTEFPGLRYTQSSAAKSLPDDVTAGLLPAPGCVQELQHALPHFSISVEAG